MNTPRLDQLLREVEARLSEQGWGSGAGLARHLGVPPQHVARWLAGKAKPNGEMALALAEWLRGKVKVKGKKDKGQKRKA